ncbi:MAG: LETM1-related biofilm-associated protein [Jejuia sp.]
MNPSATGWIKKLEREISLNDLLLSYNNELFYDSLRDCGFIYGSNQNIVAQLLPKKDFTEEEICKLNLCLALYYVYHKANCSRPFVDSVIDFYSDIKAIKTSFFKDLLGGKKSNEQLEKIIHKRIQIDGNVLTKNFNYFIINALLYIDVLAYQEYLRQDSFSITYIKNLEAAIVTISLDVLNAKATKTQYDDSLIELFKSSLRYNNNENLDYVNAVQLISGEEEKFYVLDLACMATWSDQMIDVEEQHFLEKLGEDLKLSISRIQQSIKAVNLFYTVNMSNIALLSSKNVVKSFYNNSSKMVKKLITRNRKRLYQELKDSKELLILLTQSTKRDLTKEEQQKVQEQLLDIFKSIPSLAIFMLPGGALLLPLVVKFIPKLLPSAFDENRIED